MTEADSAQTSEFVGAIGLVQRMVDEQPQYLLRWDPRRSMHRLPMTRRVDEESFRDSIEREIIWTFQLERSADILVSSGPRLHYATSLSDDDGTATRYEIEFYVAIPFGRGAEQQLSQDPHNTWVTRETLLAGRLGSEPILPVQPRLLKAADVLPRTGE